MVEPEPTRDKKTQALEMGAFVLLAVVFMGASLLRQWSALSEDPAKAVGMIVAAGLTLVMYSFLYRDNALFKIAENLYVGVALGYLAVTTWRQSLRPEVYAPFFQASSQAAFWDALLHRGVPIALGVLLLTRISKKYGWLSRYSYALMIGWGAGVAIPLFTHTFILKQLYSAVAPLQGAVQPAVAASQPAVASAMAQSWFLGTALPVLGAVILMIGTVAVLFYFFFSIEHRRAGGAVSKLGALFLMVSFGASFGYAVMGRVSLLVGRVQFLLFDWLKIPQ